MADTFGAIKSAFSSFAGFIQDDIEKWRLYKEHGADYQNIIESKARGDEHQVIMEAEKFKKIRADRMLSQYNLGQAQIKGTLSKIKSVVGIEAEPGSEWPVEAWMKLTGLSESDAERAKETGDFQEDLAGELAMLNRIKANRAAAEQEKVYAHQQKDWIREQAKWIEDANKAKTEQAILDARLGKLQAGSEEAFNKKLGNVVLDLDVWNLTAGQTDQLVVAQINNMYAKETRRKDKVREGEGFIKSASRVIGLGHDLQGTLPVLKVLVDKKYRDVDGEEVMLQPNELHRVNTGVLAEARRRHNRWLEVERERASREMGDTTVDPGKGGFTVSDEESAFMNEAAESFARSKRLGLSSDDAKKELTPEQLAFLEDIEDTLAEGKKQGLTRSQQKAALTPKQLAFWEQIQISLGSK